ncbi:unnamed protein product [Rotaria socialis]|nr:unnamed protein product [Rotaria socialis]CAF3396361.1 unnamed protein product [Rotaria socialis]CAF3406877.1 unnamed protein product [Rotaria socialis]CAF3417811.1 unnamed protein product [Rotaria socialis]CAF4115568.1 unnamed protein product [Rotaria socialis]
MTTLNVDDNNSIASRTRSKRKINASDQGVQQSNGNGMVDRVAKLWNKLNDALVYAPYFQNTNQKGVSEERIKQIESKLKVSLPTEIRTVISIHDGQNKIGYGLSHRLATTDLLPVSQWRPYETNHEECELLLECLVDKKIYETAELRDDVRDHLTAYLNGIKQASTNNRKTEYSIANDDVFHALPCELLIIGEGMDDYTEQYLLSVRTSRIYMAIHNIPEWTLIGTFSDWIDMGTENAIRDKTDIKQLRNDLN